VISERYAPDYASEIVQAMESREKWFISYKDKFISDSIDDTFYYIFEISYRNGTLDIFPIL